MIHMNLNLSIFDCYLICINVIGFILFAINTWLYSHTDEKQIDALLTITSLLGGSLGIVKSIFVCKLPSGITVDNYAARRAACSSAIRCS